MKNSHIQPITEFEHFLNRLSEEDLHLLNSMVVERIKLYHKARDMKSMAKFNLMDQVCFTHDERKIVGIVIKLNHRSVTIRTENGHKWNIAPVLLTKIIK